MPAKTKKRNPVYKWQDAFYVKSYQLALGGARDVDIASALGVRQKTFIDWRKTKPALDDALDDARSSQTHPGKPDTYLEYTYKRLPPDLQDVWQRLLLLHRDADGDIDRDAAPTTSTIEQLLGPHGTEARQRLFLHALVANNFNKSDALAMTNTTYQTMQDWARNSPQFKLLIEEMQWHQKNFFEGSLCRLVEKGDTQATIFAARTQLADRGYGEKTQVQLNLEGKITHDVQQVDVDRLDLAGAAKSLGVDIPLKDMLRVLLTAVRNQAAADAAAILAGDAIDATTTKRIA